MLDLRVNTRTLNVDIVGLDRTLVHIDKIAANLPRMVNNAVDEFARQIIVQARNNIAMRAKYIDVRQDWKKANRGKLTGNLSDKLMILDDYYNVRDGKRVRIGVEPFSNAYKYANILEYGTTGGRKIISKNRPMKFKWSRGPEGIKDKDGFVVRWSVKRGAFPGMYYMRDAVKSVALTIGPKIDRITGDIIRAK